ncbi:hypothetical protein HK44_029035 (plasmid) [Pseudomonas fluorescens HK44]|uniref:Uncharacterized protein n=1 Tax=Pseudomonas fluorescens HK44 TaxID=1042209 RepID=A0A010SI21_PSEFL|nr:hypothetical protein HK44_029035 [Pseudomonas fluorescens HK44]
MERLQRLITRLERLEADTKMETVVHFLDKEKWLGLGVIIFSSTTTQRSGWRTRWRRATRKKLSAFMRVWIGAVCTSAATA